MEYSAIFSRLSYIKTNG